MRMWIGMLLAAGAMAADVPARQEFIFPPQALHAHASSIVELPDGRLMACWYFGSGERTADDVKVQAAFLRKGAAAVGCALHARRHTGIPGHQSNFDDGPQTAPLVYLDSDSGQPVGDCSAETADL